MLSGDFKRNILLIYLDNLDVSGMGLLEILIFYRGMFARRNFFSTSLVG
jgi:hypothetical protein